MSGNATEDYSDTVEEGVIISQDTDAGKEVSKGTTIGYVVSKGPKMTVVTVPNLSYKDQNTAEKLLKQAGLTPEYIGEIIVMNIQKDRCSISLSALVRR